MDHHTFAIDPETRSGIIRQVDSRWSAGASQLLIRPVEWLFFDKKKSSIIYDIHAVDSDAGHINYSQKRL